MSFGSADWLLTYLAHSTVLLGAAWLASRAIAEHRLALREAIWRLALVGGLITATLQLATGIEAATGSWSLGAAQAAQRAPVESTAASAVTTMTRPAPEVAAISTSRPEPLPSWRPWLTGLWALGSASLLVVLALSYLRLRRRLSGRRELVAGALPSTLHRLQRIAGTDSPGLPPVRLTATRTIDVALARGVRRPEICLPEETLELFPLDRHEIVLAHELAHLHRRDPIWFALTRIVERLLFFQPLNGLARRQLQEISEFRCDDWAVEVTRRPISLAKCLTEVAERALESNTAILAPTLAANRTNLGRRVARLLKRSYPMPADKLPRWLAPGALVVFALTVLIAPGIRASAAPAPTPEGAPEQPPAVATAPLAPLAPPAPPAPVAAPGPSPSAVPAPADAPAPAAAPRSRPTPAPAPTSPAAPKRPTAPEPASPAPAPRSHEDGRVVATGDFALALDQALDELAPLIADAAAMVAPSMQAVEQAMLAAEVSTDWIEAFDFDQDQLESLRQMTERLEQVGFATEAETVRLAEMAERLIETAQPSLERLSELQERAHEMVELEQEALAEHLERSRVFEESHREEIERLREETRRSLEESSAERHELLERARRAREEARLDLDRERLSLERGRRGELREEMLRMRHELREQLRMLDEELARDGGEGTTDRADEEKR